MRSQKATTKLKNILLAIDLLLLVAVLAVAALAVYWESNTRVPGDLNYEQKLAQMAEREEQINAQIQQYHAQLAEMKLEESPEVLEAQTRVDAAQVEVTALTERRDEVQTLHDDFQDPERMKIRIADLRTKYGEAVRQLEDMILAGESDYRICYLTFDDGPSYLTPKFLDRLAELDAYATFFTIGVSMNDKGSEKLRNSYLRREAAEGHTIANHTYTHAYYGSLYKSAANFMDAVEKQDKLVYDVTGIHTDIVRFPAGSYYNPYRKSSIQALTDAGYQWMDWIGNAFDSGGHGYSSATIARTVIRQARADKITVILMHDWNADTLGSLKTIITTLREDNYLFLPLFKESTTNGNCVPKWDD